MRITKVLFILALAVACATGAHAALVFNTDFAEDGLYDVTWPMKTGEVVTVAIYVSSVPEPGLISMGFKLTYNATRLEIENAGDVTVDTINWPQAQTGVVTVPGEIDFAGLRMQGLAGDNIRLATVTFHCIGEGSSELRLLKRSDTYDGFVLDCTVQPCLPIDPSRILDGDIGTGVILANILLALPGDTNGDGDVNLADAILVLQMIAKLNPGYVHANADVDNNGVIGIQEVLFILQKVAVVR